MTKRIIALTLVLAMSLSFISFAGLPGVNEAVPEVYAYDFYFKDSNSNVLKATTSGNITAEVYAYLTDDAIDSLDVTLSIFAYHNNKIIAAEIMDETITKKPVQIKTPAVNINSGIVEDVVVEAYLTTKDFSTLLAPVAHLGSSDANVEKITIGEYEIFPEDDIYEYNLTRFFKSEESTPPLRAYTTDLSTVKEISSTDDNGVIKYTLKTVSCDTQSEKEYIINLTPIIAEDTSLASVEINGKTIKDFSPDKKEYSVAVTDGKIPVVEAFKFNSDANVVIEDAKALPGTTTIKVSFGGSDTTYKINFVEPTTVELTSDTGNASHPFGYQYRESASKVSAGTRASAYLITSDADYAKAGNYVCYAAFDTTSLGDVDIINTIDINTKQKYTHSGYVDVYNSTFDDSTGIKDEYAEILNGSAKLLGTFSAQTNKNTISVNKEDIKICDNKNIVLIFTKKYDETTADKNITINEAKLNITYLPKNLSELTDIGFDTSFIDKPKKTEIIKGDAFVSANSEWGDVNGFTLLKVNLDAEFPYECGNKNVLVKVLKPGISESDNKALTEKYAYIYNTETNDEGVINESFYLSCDAGTYTFVLSCNGYEKSISTTLTMPSADKMNELLEGLKLNTYDKDTLCAFLSANISGLSLTDSVFASFSEATRKTVSQYVIDNIDNYSASGFSKSINEGSILLGINQNETNENILKILDTDEISELLKKNVNYDDYKNADKDVLIPLLKTTVYNSYNDISDAVYENLFMLYLKECKACDDITSVITKYKNYLSQDCYMKYNGIFEEDREIINALILEKLTEIDSILKLEEIILANLPDKITVTEPSRTIHTYGFRFKNESGVSIKEVGTATKIKAEVYAQISDPAGNDIQAAFTVMTYKDGTLLAVDTTYHTITKDAKLISTNYVNITSSETTVKAILTSQDMSLMLSNVGNLGSGNGEIDDIYIGNYKLPLKEGVNEYSLTRYFDESEPVKLRVYAKDFATNIVINEKETDGIISYTVKATSSDGNNEEEYKINLRAYDVNGVSLVGVEINGNSIKDFSPAIKEYYIGVKGAIVPEVKAYKYSTKAVVTISDAISIPGTTVIKVTNGELTETYNIHFVEIKNSTLTYADSICRSGNNSSSSEYTVRASSEPMSGGSSKVLYHLFDLNKLGNILIKDIRISGLATTDIKLYFYNSSYSSIDEVTPHTESNFKEIYDGLVSYLGEYKFSKGETATISLDLNNIKIKDNKIMILVRKKYGDVNASDYGQFQNAQLKLEYAVKPSSDTVISEVSDKSFDISLLDRGELTYQATEGAQYTVDKKWTGSNNGLKLQFTASFPKECAKKNVYIKAIRPDVNENSQLQVLEKYAYLDTYTLDDKATLSEEIFFNESSGNYKFVMTCENYEIPLETMVYIPSSDKMETLLNDIKNGNHTSDTMYQYIVNNKQELALDKSNILTVTATSGKKVCQYIIDNIETYTADSFNKAMSEGLVLCGINHLEGNTIIEALLLEDAIYSKLNEDKNYLDYSNMTDKTLFLSEFKSENFNELSDVKEAFFENLLVVKLSGIKSYLSVEGLIDSYSDYIDSSVYNNYSSLGYDARTAVNKKIADNIKFITSISKLEAKMKDFIDNPNGDNSVITPPVSSGGGGGGGGGSLGNVTTPAPEIVAPVEMNFKDVSRDYWGYSYIENLYLKKIISGKSETEFCPEDKVTRAEFIKMLVVAMDIEGNTSTVDFTDVSKDSWYYDYVNIGVSNGIIQGIGENSFAPDKSITRQDASVMINRILKLEQSKEELFNDDESIAEYAKNAVYALKENNIVKGYEGNFNPLSDLTRAEAAVLICNLLNK